MAAARVRRAPSWGPATLPPGAQEQPRAQVQSRLGGQLGGLAAPLLRAGAWRSARPALRGLRRRARAARRASGCVVPAVAAPCWVVGASSEQGVGFAARDMLSGWSRLQVGARTHAECGPRELMLAARPAPRRWAPDPADACGARTRTMTTRRASMTWTTLAPRMRTWARAGARSRRTRRRHAWRPRWPPATPAPAGRTGAGSACCEMRPASADALVC